MAIKKVSSDRIARNARKQCWHDGWTAVADANNKLCHEAFSVFEDTESITYAVYNNDSRRLVCMLKHASTALRLDQDDEFEAKLLDIHRQEAIDEGFQQTLDKPAHGITGRELIDMIHEMNAENLVVFVGSEGYASALYACDADEYRVVGDNGVRIDRCLLLHDSTGIYYTDEVSLYE